MSDYIFMLDSHLNSEQSKALNIVKEAAADAGLNVFLTGGAMRDMLGGFPIRDLDFTLEGAAVKFASSLASHHGAQILRTDDVRKSVQLRFPFGVTIEIGMARQERYPKPGAKPIVHQATIHEDLRGRDFTVNSIGLSLSRASFGLLLDPTNGLADIERKELHAVSNYGLFDDPSRILRLIRLKIRLAYNISERTQAQYSSAREAKMETKISGTLLGRELYQIATEPAALDVLQALDREKLLSLFAPSLTGAKLNVIGFQKLQKARQVVPIEAGLRVDEFTLFLNLLVEKLSPKERKQLLAATEIDKSKLDAALRLDTNMKKLERALGSAKVQKASALYAVLSKVPGEEVLHLLMKSNQRLVVDRTRNYLQKHLLTAQEVTDAMVMEKGVTPGSPKFAKVREEMVAARLDSRPRKVPAIEIPPPPPPPVAPARRQSTWGR